MTGQLKFGTELNWSSEDYFDYLLKSELDGYSYALELLVDDLHKNKQKTINRLICHAKQDQYLKSLLHLLENPDPRVAGNTAYIFGSVIETEIGCYRFLNIVSSDKSFQVLNSLIQMLKFTDGETVMNAAGTLGTLAESKEGRQWILEDCTLDELITNITCLLLNSDVWTASNAALVLARLTISDLGCQKLLQHGSNTYLLKGLCHCLGNDEAGRGMNAAFALGRLVDSEIGYTLLSKLPKDLVGSITSVLIDMVQSTDVSASKNACFCISCLASSNFGHSLIMTNNSLAKQLMSCLVTLLLAVDSEVAWFAALTIRTIATLPKGTLLIKNDSSIEESLINVLENPKASSDLKEEIVLALEFLKPLSKPQSPTATLQSDNVIHLTWSSVELKSGFTVVYQLFLDDKCIYTGSGLEFLSVGHEPCTNYSFRLRASTETGVSPFSDEVSITTEEAVADPPSNLRVVATTATQMRVAWELPLTSKAVIKGYYVYCEGRQTEFTTELTTIISGLTPSTACAVSVCASSAKGKSAKSVVVGTTLDLGAHAPAKPQVNVLGRQELSVTWEAPEKPLGRLTRYDVLLNGRKVVYSGTDLACKVQGLSPDTEYAVSVVVVTNEGKAESQIRKRRTAKDEFDPQRAPLWAPNRRHSLTSIPSQAGTDEGRESASPTLHRKSSKEHIKPFVKKSSKNFLLTAETRETEKIVPNQLREQQTTAVEVSTLPPSSKQEVKTEPKAAKPVMELPVKQSFFTFDRFSSKETGFLTKVAPQDKKISQLVASSAEKTKNINVPKNSPSPKNVFLRFSGQGQDKSSGVKGNSPPVVEVSSIGENMWTPHETFDRKLKPLKSKKSDKSVWNHSESFLTESPKPLDEIRKRPLPSVYGEYPGGQSSTKSRATALSTKASQDELKAASLAQLEWSPDFPQKKTIPKTTSSLFLPSSMRQTRQRTSIVLERLNRQHTLLPLENSQALLAKMSMQSAL